MWRCGSCVFFKSHKPVTPGAGGNSECLRTPGYYRSGVMDACAFYAKKGKKVAKKKIPLCTNCDAPFGKDGEYTLPNLEGKVCFKCYENLCDSPIYLVNNRDKKCGRCDGPLGDHTKAVEGYSRLLCAKCGEETAEEHFTCVNCECKTEGKAHYVKGGKKPLCIACYEYLTTGKPRDKKTESFTCSECGETDHATAHKVPGIEGFVCYRCLELLKKDRPTVMGVAKVKKVKALCSTCGKYEAKGLTDSKGNFVCYYCHHRELPVAEIPVYERYLVVEGRGAWPCTNVYTHDFTDLEGALKFVSRFRPDSCKMFKVTAASPITLEELSLGCDIKVTSTHVMEVPTK